MSTTNPSLAAVRPGTPLGEYFRAHWLPFLPAAELSPRVERPVRVQLLAERLVAFRTGRDEVGLIDALCPHAGADMFWGITEEDGLRCTYHGWKFAINGACIDTPMHGPGRGYDTRAFPVVERGGLFWTHLGEAEGGSEPPTLAWEGPASVQRLGRPLVDVLADLMSRPVSSAAMPEARATDRGVELIQASGPSIALILPGLITIGGSAALYVVPADGATTIALHLGKSPSTGEEERPAESTLLIVGEAVAKRLERALTEFSVS